MYGGQIMRRVLSGILVALCFSVFIAVASAVDVKQVEVDWSLIDSLLTQRDFFLYQSEFDKDPAGFADKWVPFAELFRKHAAELTERYGTERVNWMTAFEGAEKPEGIRRENYDIVNEYLGADIDGLQRNIIGWAESMGSEQYGNWERLANPDSKQIELKHRYAQKALLGYQVAAKLQPDTDYGDSIKKCENAEKETREQFQKTLESLTWPGNNPDFDGPGKPKELAEAALEFLSDNPDWSKPEYDDVHVPYAACVNGKGWEVWKKNSLTEVPTQFSIDMLVAFTGRKNPDMVYVYSMVFYTAEEEGVEKGLPFKYANSKLYQKYQMLKSSVPEGASTKKAKRSESESAAVSSGSDNQAGEGNGKMSGSTSDEKADRASGEKKSARSRDDQNSSGGSSFGAIRLLFGLLLICGGCVGARAVLNTSIPAVKPVLDKLSAFSMPIGLALVFLGLTGFLCNLLRFVPHASFLPQAAGVILGLILVRKTPGIIPVDYAEKLKSLDSMEVPVSAASVVLGFLHLIIGGLPLL